MHGEEAKGPVEIHPGVGHFVARFECTGHHAECGDGSGFESLGEEAGQHVLGAAGDGQRDGAQPGQV